MNTAPLSSHAPTENALPVVDHERCNGCGWCAQACHCRAIVLSAAQPRIDPTRCGNPAECPPDCPSAGLCEDACPTQAIYCSFVITDQD
ncbi:MAG: 4Fe-4S binding protein [Chloroflexi bacterium]|nr:4Fe-4S binding protein [Chloroflexota bacterium]